MILINCVHMPIALLQCIWRRCRNVEPAKNAIEMEKMETTDPPLSDDIDRDRDLLSAKKTVARSDF